MLSAADLATLESVYATVVPLRAPRDGAAQMARALERLPEARLRRIEQLLKSLRSPVLSIALIGQRAPFMTLGHEHRERYLRTMSESPMALLRTGYAALVRLALFVAYSGDDGGVRNRLWEDIHYLGPRQDVPIKMVSDAIDEALPAATLLAATNELPARVDAIVIGSGAGGGVAAGVLAERGMRVLVLEAGPWPEAVARMQRELDAFAELYLESGLASNDDLSLAILAGACVGGGTTVNWTTSLRLRENVAAQWSEAAGGIDFGQTLGPHYAAIEERLGIASQEEHNPNNAVIVRGCEKLGWSWKASPRNARGCGEGCGYCGFGCAYEKKASTLQTYLHEVRARGGWVVAGAPVRKIVVEKGRATGVRVRINGTEKEIRSDCIVVAAGALRTPGLLARSGVSGAHIGKHLHVHPTTAIVARFDDPIEPWLGPMQTALSDEFTELEQAYGVTFEVAPAHPGLSALSLPWRGRDAHAEIMRASRYNAALIALVRDRDTGSIATDESETIHYRLSDFDARHIKHGLKKLGELAFAAGAQRIQTLHTRPISAEKPDALPSFAREIDGSDLGPNRITLFSAHQMGTARMHADARHGVVDEFGRVHGIENLIVADASIFPLASGVNPMLTIMALAHRIAMRSLNCTSATFRSG